MFADLACFERPVGLDGVEPLYEFPHEDILDNGDGFGKLAVVCGKDLRGLGCLIAWLK